MSKSEYKEEKELDKEIKEDYTENLPKEEKEEEKKVFTPKPRPSTEIKSPIKKSYEETKHVSSTSKDSEFGSTFNNAKSDSDGFESF